LTRNLESAGGTVKTEQNGRSGKKELSAGCLNDLPNDVPADCRGKISGRVKGTETAPVEILQTATCDDPDQPVVILKYLVHGTLAETLLYVEGFYLYRNRKGFLSLTFEGTYQQQEDY